MFPPLPTAWDSTRAHLHAHTASVGAVASAHLPPHPKWWHVSLTVAPDGLTTDPITLPDERLARVAVDPGTNVLRVVANGATFAEYSLAEPPSRVAPALFDAMSDLGLEGPYDADRLHADPDGEYDSRHAAAFWGALREVAHALEERRAAREGKKGPVQLWPHGFDIAFEWFGTRTATYGEDGDAEALPAQLNLGWYPGKDAYFFSNPWPFDDGLTEHQLPEPAEWHTEGWEGTILRYADVAGDPSGPATFARYADTVFELARPTLMA